MERPGEEEVVQFKLRTENYAKLDCGITGKMPDQVPSFGVEGLHQSYKRGKGNEPVSMWQKGNRLNARELGRIVWGWSEL